MAANQTATNLEEDTEFRGIAEEDKQMMDITQPFMNGSPSSQEALDLAFAETEAAYRSELYEDQVQEHSATAHVVEMGAEQEHSIIHSNDICYWQCHMCGYHNNLALTVRDFWRAYPSVLNMQTACLNPSNDIIRSNNTNSGSRVFPNDVMCGHDRCGWCVDLDADGRAVRFGSGQALSREQYEAFWGWRYWAELNGIPEGHVTWAEYNACCMQLFGGVPTLQPLAVEADAPEQDAAAAASADGGGGMGDGDAAGGGETLGGGGGGGALGA